MIEISVRVLRVLSVIALLIGMVACNQSFNTGSSSSNSAVISGKGPGTKIVDLPEGEYFVEIKVSGNRECTETTVGQVCEGKRFAVSLDEHEIVNRTTESWADVITLIVGDFGHVAPRFPIVVNSAPSGSWELRFTPESIPTPTPAESSLTGGVS